jgi:hypothetical protein
MVNITSDNLRVRRYGSQNYVAEIINYGKSKRRIAGGVFSIYEVRQWKHMVIAFEKQIKEL